MKELFLNLSILAPVDIALYQRGGLSKCFPYFSVAFNPTGTHLWPSALTEPFSGCSIVLWGCLPSCEMYDKTKGSQSQVYCHALCWHKIVPQVWEMLCIVSCTQIRNYASGASIGTASRKGKLPWEKSPYLFNADFQWSHQVAPCSFNRGLLFEGAVLGFAVHRLGVDHF